MKPPAKAFLLPNDTKMKTYVTFANVELGKNRYLCSNNKQKRKQ